MGEETLWKDYAEALEREKESNNRERDALYREMHTLRQELQGADHEITSLKAILAAKQEQIMQLQNKDSVQQQQLISMLEERGLQIEELARQVSHYQSLQETYPDSETHRRAVELAGNYLKVESHAKQLKAENQAHLASIQKFEEQVEKLTKEVEHLKCGVISADGNRSVLKTPPASQLIKQNNTLIEKMIQMSQQKMLMYSSLKQGSQTQRFRSVSKSVKSANLKQLESLKQKNKQLMNTLRF